MNRVFLKFSLKMALRSMSIHKVRSFLTILAIAWSVATLVALRTVGVGIRSRVEEEVGRFLQSDILIMERSVSIPEQVVKDIKEIPYVEDAIGVIFVPAKIQGRGVDLVAVPANRMDFFLVNILSGKLPVEGGYKLVIDTDLAYSLGVLNGSYVKMSIDYGTLHMEHTFEIAGISEGKTFLSRFLGTTFVLAPLKPVQEMLDKEGLINYIFVKVSDKNQIDYVARVIKKVYPGATIIKEKDIVVVITRVLNIVDGMLMAVTAIGLLVAAVGVMNTIMMSIRERIREIGILKTIGAKDEHIFTIFIMEVIIMGLIGGILGMILGYIGSFFVKELVISLGLTFDIPITPVPEAFILGFTIALTISILSALYPIYRVVKIRPMEALRIE